MRCRVPRLLFDEGVNTICLGTSNHRFLQSQEHRDKERNQMTFSAAARKTPALVPYVSFHTTERTRMSVKCTFSTTDSGTKQERSVKADRSCTCFTFRIWLLERRTRGRARSSVSPPTRSELGRHFPYKQHLRILKDVGFSVYLLEFHCRCFF